MQRPKGQEFNSVREQNEFLIDWERNVADTRVHGTTREQVAKAFERERPALTPLPATLFPCFREGRRSVHRDGHVEVAKAYYSVPPEHVQREVWVRWDGRVVRIFNMRMEQVAMHAQAAPGKFSTDRRHLPKEKVSSVERGLDWLLQRSREIGPGAAGWAEAMTMARGVRALRVLQGLLGLSHKLGGPDGSTPLAAKPWASACSACASCGRWPTPPWSSRPWISLRRIP